MGVVRESGSRRLRASLRGVLPAIATLGLFLGVQAVLGAVFAPTGTALSLGDTVLVRSVLVLLYVVMIVGGVRIAGRLDRRDYTAFGLNVDREWGRNFVAGVVLSASGIGLSLWWGVVRGFRAIDVSSAVTGPGDPLYAGVALVVLAVYLLLGNVYEEILYRGVMLQNFAEGLTARGFSPAWAVAPATAGSLVLFGLYHLPLRGNLLVVVDAAMVGVTFALAYLLTGELGLAIGVHFGRLPTVFLNGTEILGVEVPAMLVFTRDTLAANLELKLLEIGAVCTFLVAWVYLQEGEVGIAEAVYEPTDAGPGAD